MLNSAGFSFCSNFSLIVITYTCLTSSVLSTASPKRIHIQSGETILLEHLSDFAHGYGSFEPINQYFN